MKKLFLTSGIVLCMACPAFATDITPGKTSEENCTDTYLGSGAGDAEETSLEAKWTPNFSGAIALHSDIYANNDHNGTALYTGANNDGLTTATASTLYSAYQYGVYSSQQNASTYESATKYTQLSVVPSKAGYTFNGFKTADGATTVISSTGAVLQAAQEQVQTTGGTADWYANWTPITYNVIYNPGTAKTSLDTHTVSGNAYTDANGVYDANYTVLNNTNNNLGFEQTGYHFTGWLADYDIANNTASALGADYTTGGTAYAAGDTPKYKVVGAVNMYAQWAPDTYTVRYNPGTYAAANTNAYDDTATYDTAYTMKTFSGAGMTEATGYTFAGWTTDSTPTFTNGVLDNEWNGTTAKWTSTSGQTVYAAYTANSHTISFTCGSKGNASSDFTQGGEAPSSVGVTFGQAYAALPGTAGTCALPGYHFNGWSCGNGIVSEGGTYNVDADTTCAATWAPNTISLNWTINENDTNVTFTAPENDSCIYDGELTLPDPAPSRTGYTFNGWKVVETTPAAPAAEEPVEQSGN